MRGILLDVTAGSRRLPAALTISQVLGEMMEPEGFAEVALASFSLAKFRLLSFAEFRQGE